MILAVVFLAALIVRAAAVVNSDFPINDGGLFLAMIDELERQGGWLPNHVSSNGHQIPFAYPPLGFYLTSAVATVTGIDTLLVMRVLPTVLSAVAAALVAAIGMTLLRSAAGSVAAGLTYAFAPAAFSWAIAGGGVTRAPGIALGLTTLWLLLRLPNKPTHVSAGLLGLATGATILTHPASAAFTALSAAFLLVAAMRSKQTNLKGSGHHLIAAAAVGVVVVAPWAAAVMAEHGPRIFVEVASNGPDPEVALITLVAGRVTGLGSDPLGLVIAGGAIMSALRGRFLLPAWVLMSSFLGSQYAIVAGSILVGSLVADAIRMGNGSAKFSRLGGRAVVGVIVTLIAVEAGAGVGASTVEASHLHALSADRRDAMAWISSNTPPDATVVVLTGDHWSTDPDSEWFFVVAHRTSVATVQGQEWLGRAAYARASDRYAKLQRCTVSVACLDSWLRDNSADYLFIPKGRRHGPHSPVDCCPGIREEIMKSESHKVVYDRAGATIVRLRVP
ncbi:MAG: glycosyltransferase family 39 protein [Chloroflexi bacterium]|nr:glycosyltransferase family 39 protein [Chloroflexota bacterium]